MPFQAVLFDLDGTLLDTLVDLAEAMNTVLAGLELPVHPVANYRYYVGDGMRNLALRVLPADRLDLADEVIDLMWHEYHARRGATTQPYDGVPALLDALVARELRLAVLSNKPDDLAKLVVGEKLGRWPFAVVLGARDGVPVKPDPSAAREILAHLGLAPDQVLYVGDTATDMHTAAAAGMPAVGAVWGFRTADELQAAGARWLAEGPGDVLAALDAGS